MIELETRQKRGRPMTRDGNDDDDRPSAAGSPLEVAPSETTCLLKPPSETSTTSHPNPPSETTSLLKPPPRSSSGKDETGDDDAAFAAYQASDASPSPSKADGALGAFEARDITAEEVMDTLKLAGPIFLSSLSWVGMKTTDTALLGRAGSEYLSAAALSDLYTMCTGVLVRGRVLGILVGGAVGAGNDKLAGTYLQVSYVVLGLVSMGVMVSWFLTERVWTAFGEGEKLSSDAGYYATVLALSIPGQVAAGQLSQFFAARRIVRPEAMASAVALILNFVLGLYFVLGVPRDGWDGYGFVACPIVTTGVVYVQIFALWYVFCHRMKLHTPCWDGWDWGEITWERISTYCRLYFPAALGLASDFWRMGVVGAVAAKLGDLEVAVFNTSYRILWITLVAVNSVAGAGGIKTSLHLGQGDPISARRAGYVGVAVATAILFVVTLIVGFKTRAMGRIFTEDEEFLDAFEGTALPFAAALFAMNLSVAIERVPMSMGRTGEVFWMGFAASWLGQVPGVLLLTKYWRNDLVGLYTGMALGYVVLSILYAVLTLTSDWKKCSELAMMRSEKKKQ